MADLLSVDGTGKNPAFSLTGIGSTATGTGDAGSVTVNAERLSIIHNGQISGITFGSGNGGSVTVGLAGELSINGAGADPAFLTGISSQANKGSAGNAGRIAVTAGSLAIADGGQIQSVTFTSGNGGDVTVTALGDVFINGSGTLVPTGVLSSTKPASTGRAGQVVLTAGGAITLMGGAEATSGTAGAGNGGSVRVTAQGPLGLSDPGSGIIASAASTASGNAGSVTVNAPQFILRTGAVISSTTAGTGAGGSVIVTTPGALVLDGAGVAHTQIAASATGAQSGPGGSVIIAANSLSVAGGAQIASSTTGPGTGGDVDVTVANGVSLSGTGPNGTRGITASAEPGSSGQAGEVVLTAGGAITLMGGAEATSGTAGAGNGGSVRVTAQGPLGLSDPGSGIIASAASTASGNSGSVTVNAPQITLSTGAEISSTWKAQLRLCSRYRRLAAIGKPKVVVTTAIAREMVGFIWVIAGITQPVLAA